MKYYILHIYASIYPKQNTFEENKRSLFFFILSLQLAQSIEFWNSEKQPKKLHHQ